MQTLELVLSFAIGITLILLLCWVFALKTKGLLRVAFNSIGALILVLAFNLLKIVYLPLNPLNVLLIGFLGIPGAVIVAVITLIL